MFRVVEKWYASFARTNIFARQIPSLYCFFRYKKERWDLHRLLLKARLINCQRRIQWKNQVHDWIQNDELERWARGGKENASKIERLPIRIYAFRVWKQKLHILSHNDGRWKISSSIKWTKLESCAMQIWLKMQKCRVQIHSFNIKQKISCSEWKNSSCCRRK